MFRNVDDLRGKIDAHLLRPGFDDANWPRLEALLRALATRDKLAPSFLEHATRYFERFVRHRQVKQEQK